MQFVVISEDRRCTLMRRGYGLTLFLIAVVLTGCATLPPARPVQNVKSIAGTWEGTVSAPGGGRFWLRFTINEDGSYLATLVNGVTIPGNIRADGGQLFYRAAGAQGFVPGGLGGIGTMSLHEGDGTPSLDRFSGRRHGHVRAQADKVS